MTNVVDIAELLFLICQEYVVFGSRFDLRFFVWKKIYDDTFIAGLINVCSALVIPVSRD